MDRFERDTPTKCTTGILENGHLSERVNIHVYLCIRVADDHKTRRTSVLRGNRAPHCSWGRVAQLVELLYVFPEEGNWIKQLLDKIHSTGSFTLQKHVNRPWVKHKSKLMVFVVAPLIIPSRPTPKIAKTNLKLADTNAKLSGAKMCLLGVTPFPTLSASLKPYLLLGVFRENTQNGPLTTLQHRGLIIRFFCSTFFLGNCLLSTCFANQRGPTSPVVTQD